MHKIKFSFAVFVIINAAKIKFYIMHTYIHKTPNAHQSTYYNNNNNIIYFAYLSWLQSKLIGMNSKQFDLLLSSDIRATTTIIKCICATKVTRVNKRSHYYSHCAG